MLVQLALTSFFVFRGQKTDRALRLLREKRLTIIVRLNNNRQSDLSQ